ncbi:MAG: transposase [Candidatus Dormiibacterota bacterium]
MRREHVLRLEDGFLRTHRTTIRELDQALRGSRGPRLISVAYLFGGFILTYLARRHVTVTEVAEFFQHEAKEFDLRLFADYGSRKGKRGRHFKPSVSQLYRVKTALCHSLTDSAASSQPVARIQALIGSDATDGLLDGLCRMLLEGTWPVVAANGRVAVDTSLIDAHAKPISQARIEAGDRASDPDARHRILTPEHGVTKRYFGYGYQAICTCGPGHEYIIALAVNPANANDRPVAASLVRRLKESGVPVDRVLMDRGFSDSARLLNQLRGMGCHPVFDLKSNQDRRSPDWRGNLVLDGRPYLRTLPNRLRYLPMPGVQRPEAEFRVWRKAIAERDRYGFLPNGKGSPTSIRLQSPLFRNRGFACPKVEGSIRRWDEDSPVCDGNHAADEGCAVANGTWKAQYAPRTFQFPFWGSPDWVDEFGMRSSIERSFNLMKNRDVIGLRPGEFRLRGIANMTLLLGLAAVAVNLHLQGRSAPEMSESSRAPVPKVA